MLAYALAVVLGVASVADVPNPRPDSWVSDQAHVLDAGAKAKLDALAADLNKTRGIELAVVTVDDTPGVPKAFATELFHTWKIGSATANNGVLVLLVMSKHRVEVETGTGIEAALPADWLATMQHDAMVPLFKAKDFAGGLAAGVAAISEHLRDAPGEATGSAAAGTYRDNGAVAAQPPAENTVPLATAKPIVRPHYPRDDGWAWWMWALVIGGPLLVIGWIAAYMKKKRRREARASRRAARAANVASGGVVDTTFYDDDDDDDDYTGVSVRTGFFDWLGSSSSSSSSSDSSTSSFDSSSSSDTSSGGSDFGGGSSDGGGAGSDW